MGTTRSTSAPGRILVVLGTRGLGDIVEAGPTFRMIKEQWPDADIHAGCNTPSQETTASMVPEIAGCVSLPPGIVKSERKTLRQFGTVRRAMRGFDTVLILYKKKVSRALVLAGRLAGARVLHRHDFHYRDSRRSAYSTFPEHVFCQIVAADLLNIPVGRLRETHLEVLPEDAEYAAEFFRSRKLHGRPIAMFNTLSSPKIPDWALSRFVEVANQLMSAGVTVIFNGGSKQQVREFEAVASDLRGPVELLERPTPGQLTAVIARCDLFVGGGSGPIHIASAVGTPNLLVGGPGEHGYPAQGRAGPVWWPRKPHDRVVSRLDWCQITQGRGCTCRFPQRKPLGKKAFKAALKILRIWKPVKRSLKTMNLYKKPEPRPIPCLHALTADDVATVALAHLNGARRGSERAPTVRT